MSIDAVTVDRGCIVLILDPEAMKDAVRRMASESPTTPTGLRRTGYGRRLVADEVGPPAIPDERHAVGELVVDPFLTGPHHNGQRAPLPFTVRI
jgi:hypothetical protein